MRNTGRILIVAVALTAPAVHAEVFIGASVGQTTVEQGSFNADANSFKLIFGYRRSGVFSVEGGYVDFGKPDDVSGSNSLEIDLTGWNVFAVGTIPIGKKFELFGKGGVLLWDADFSGTVFTTRESGTDLAFGIGGSYQVGNSVRIRGEYEIYEIDNVSDVTMISGGVEIRF